MRWWVLSDDAPPLDGGIATWTAAVCRALADEGAPVTLLTRRRADLADLPGVRMLGVPGPSFARWGGRWLGLALAPRLRPGDRVLATTWPVATGVTGTCRRLGIPLEVVAHGSDITREPLDARGRQRVLAGARWWAVSHFLAGQVRTLGTPCAVLPAPIAAATPMPPASRPRWVMLGRATPLKGGDRAIRLAAAAAVPLDVIGDGPGLPAWRALAASLGAPVTFHGRLPHARVPSVLTGAHAALLLPRCHADGSGAEGFGLALTEAAAVGVPAVGCRIGGVPEAVGPGLLLDDPDDVADSVAAIRSWWTPERGVQAHAWLTDHHGPDRVVARLRSPP